LATEHDELMSEHQQFDIFGELAAPASNQQPQNSREREVGEGEEHPPMLPDPTIGRSKIRNLGFGTPHGAGLFKLRDALTNDLERE